MTELTAAQKKLYDEAVIQGPRAHIHARQDVLHALFKKGYVTYTYAGNMYYMIKIEK